MTKSRPLYIETSKPPVNWRFWSFIIKNIQSDITKMCFRGWVFGLV